MHHAVKYGAKISVRFIEMSALQKHFSIDFTLAYINLFQGQLSVLA